MNLKKVFSELVPGGDINFVLTTAAKAAGASKKRGRAELSGACSLAAAASPPPAEPAAPALSCPLLRVAGT